MVRTIRTLVVLAVVSLVLGALPGAALANGHGHGRYTPGAPGIGDPYYPLDGNGGYDVRHYDLDLRFDPDTDRLSGTATIRARATQDLSAFDLDFVGLTVRSVKVDGRSAGWRRDGQELVVTPRHGLRRGTSFQVAVRYDGVPEPVEDIFGTSGFMQTDDGALVIGQPHVAATWFPANDHPRDKASVTLHMAVPTGLEVVSNGVLQGTRSRHGWTTWTWDAREPMVPYLLGMGIGEFVIDRYRANGVRYWDAIDPALTAAGSAPIEPVDGNRLVYSQIADSAYKRLTRVIDVPAGGAEIDLRVNRDTEEAFDFFFVEARTAGGSDWTTLPDANGHTTQDTGACPGFSFANPFLDHYLTEVPPDEGDPDNPDDDVFFPCDPTGTTGEWNAAMGASDGWEEWSIALPNAGTTTRHVEVSFTYATDGSVQYRGVALDAIVVSTGQGSTSFESASLPVDGWVAQDTVPEGSTPNLNTWVILDEVPPLPGPGDAARAAFARQPEVIAWESSIFGRYPFATAGGVVDHAFVGFALEIQGRPFYSQGFFGGNEGDMFVVVHELAHQWYGDSVAVDTWQHIWLNEGFATYAEWLWGEREGFGTIQEIFDSYGEIPADDPFWELTIGDPGPDHLFDFEVYARGALTLHALRLEVGDRTFFRILREWASRRSGGTGTSAQFQRLAERLSHRDLDALFDAWLFTPAKPDAFGTPTTLRRMAAGAPSFRDLPASTQSLVQRLRDRPGQPFKDVPAK